MVEFTLPKNSRIVEGKTWPAADGASDLKTFRIYRWDPDTGEFAPALEVDVVSDFLVLARESEILVAATLTMAERELEAYRAVVAEQAVHLALGDLEELPVSARRADLHLVQDGGSPCAGSGRYLCDCAQETQDPSPPGRRLRILSRVRHRRIRGHG